MHKDCDSLLRQDHIVKLDAPTPPICNDVKVVDSIDPSAVEQAIAMVDIRIKKCLWIGMVRHQADLINGCKVDVDNPLNVAYVVALALLMNRQ
jgi:hypothetical protein